MALDHFGYWWRSRFSRLLSGKFKLSVGVVFDFATSITLGAYCLFAELKESYIVQTIQLVINSKRTLSPQSGHEPDNVGIYRSVAMLAVSLFRRLIVS